MHWPDSLYFREELVYMLGANEDTYPFASEYLHIMLLFGFVFTIENTFSTFVRNDGNPNLAMLALIVTALSNIGINYLMLYVFHLGVKGAAFGTIIAAFLGLLVLSAHFFHEAKSFEACPFPPRTPIVFPNVRLWISELFSRGRDFFFYRCSQCNIGANCRNRWSSSIFSIKLYSRCHADAVSWTWCHDSAAH